MAAAGSGRGQSGRRRVVAGRHRRRPPAQRGRLRLGESGPGGARDRQRRRPARRRPPGRRRSSVCPGPPSTRPPRRRWSSPSAPDIKDELPVLYLRLRDAVRERGTQIVELTPAPTGLSPYAAETVTYRPGEVAALAAAVAGSEPVTGEVAGVRAGPSRRCAPTSPGPGKRAGPDAPSVVVILGRPSLAEPEDAGGGRGPGTGRAARRGLSLRPCAGPTCTAPSTWAWPRGCCPGRVGARCRPGLVRAPLGRRPAGPARPDDRRRSWRRPAGAGSAAWSCSAPTPAPTSPTPSWP